MLTISSQQQLTLLHSAEGRMSGRLFWYRVTSNLSTTEAQTCCFQMIASIPLPQMFVLIMSLNSTWIAWHAILKSVIFGGFIIFSIHILDKIFGITCDWSPGLQSYQRNIFWIMDFVSLIMRWHLLFHSWSRTRALTPHASCICIVLLLPARVGLLVSFGSADCYRLIRMIGTGCCCACACSCKVQVRG